MTNKQAEWTIGLTAIGLIMVTCIGFFAGIFLAAVNPLFLFLTMPVPYLLYVCYRLAGIAEDFRLERVSYRGQ